MTTREPEKLPIVPTAVAALGGARRGSVTGVGAEAGASITTRWWASGATSARGRSAAAVVTAVTRWTGSRTSDPWTHGYPTAPPRPGRSPLAGTGAAALTANRSRRFALLLTRA